MAMVDTMEPSSFELKCRRAMRHAIWVANRASRRDSLAALSPMFERRGEPPRLSSAELHGYVIATGTNHELKAIWASSADLHAFQRRL